MTAEQIVRDLLALNLQAASPRIRDLLARAEGYLENLTELSNDVRLISGAE